MKALLTANILNIIRNTIHTEGATLTFYKMTPANGEQPVLTLTSGWYIQRYNRVIFDHNRHVNIWIARNATNEGLDEHLHNGVRVTVHINGRTLNYRIRDIIPMAQLNTGWVANCDPLDSSTDPNNAD